MNISVKPGKYVVAVSGGVDSMVLLALLHSMPGLDLVVAHFEHGIRDDSDNDRQLVEQTAQRYGLPFYCEHGDLGSRASEAAARLARYAFLRRIQQECGARAVITAHHQDDLLETVIINILRGTGRKGLSSLSSGGELVRPMLHISKAQIYAEASNQMQAEPQFSWNVDSTNNSDVYLRNYIRHHYLKGLGADSRQLLLDYAQKATETNPLIDMLLLHHMDNTLTPAELRRGWFIMLPYDVSCEVMAAWLRQNGLRDFDRKTIARLVVAAKVAFPGKVADINAGYLLKTEKTVLRIAQSSPS